VQRQGGVARILLAAAAGVRPKQGSSDGARAQPDQNHLELPLPSSNGVTS